MLNALLYSFWQRAIKPENNNLASSTWNEELEVLYGLGIGMEETLHFLYNKKPSISEFEEWIEQHKIETSELKEIEIENILSETDLLFWKENGYVVIKNVISEQDCELSRAAIWEFLQMNPNDKSSWYKPHIEQKGMMLTLTNHPALNKNRESLKIKRAYEQLYNSKQIYKTIDKVSFNLPVTPHYKFAGSELHWDISLKPPIPLGMQGLLYLSDCSETDGAFHCVPGFHNDIDTWLSNLPATEHPRAKVTHLKSTPITGKAGDFIIWHHALPHCATPNYGQYPRLVQYLTYKTIGYKEAEEWI